MSVHFAKKHRISSIYRKLADTFIVSTSNEIDRNRKVTRQNNKIIVTINTSCYIFVLVFCFYFYFCLVLVSCTLSQFKFNACLSVIPMPVFVVLGAASFLFYFFIVTFGWLLLLDFASSHTRKCVRASIIRKKWACYFHLLNEIHNLRLFLLFPLSDFKWLLKQPYDKNT